jgi:hypothetical protein
MASLHKGEAIYLEVKTSGFANLRLKVPSSAAEIGQKHSAKVQL